MSKIYRCVFGGRFQCCKPALLLLEIPPICDWDLSGPCLLRATFGAGNQHNVLCTSFDQKYVFNTKAGIVKVLLIGTSVKLNTMQTDLE